VEEGEVVVGFLVAAGGDAAFCFEPGVGALDGPAVACLGVAGLQPSLLASPDLAGWCAGGDRLAGSARLADPRLDLTLAQSLLDCRRGVAAVSPQLVGVDAARGERIEEWQQVPLLVLVAGREPDLEWRPGGVYDEVVAAAGPAQERARDLLAPFFASTNEASTITRDQSSLSTPTSCFCSTAIAAGNSPRADHSSKRRRQVSPDGRLSSR